MSGRFDPYDGTPLVALPPFRLTDRAIEVIAAGEAESWIIIPAHNEEAALTATLAACAAQTLRPLMICVVDNASTDATAEGVRRFTPPPGVGLALVAEPERGTGAAADTGMRVAIAAGARYLLRTDADTLPYPDWAARLVARLQGGLDLVGGKTRPRDDEGLGRGGKLVLRLLLTIANLFAVLRNHRRGMATRYRMIAGHNLGIRAEVYERVGGFPRSRIDEVHEDRALINRVRRHSPRVAIEPRAYTATSARRHRVYGTIGVLRWYANHDSSGAPVDVR